MFKQLHFYHVINDIFTMKSKKYNVQQNAYYSRNKVMFKFKKLLLLTSFFPFIQSDSTSKKVQIKYWLRLMKYWN